MGSNGLVHEKHLEQYPEKVVLNKYSSDYPKFTDEAVEPRRLVMTPGTLGQVDSSSCFKDPPASH